MIQIAHKNTKKFPEGAIVIDVTSKATDEFIKLSPFYPHGGIPVPGMANHTSYSVEGVWQGLKKFANQGVSYRTFRNNTMKGLKRTVRTNGTCFGHSYNGQTLGYIEARKLIYVPTYYWMLEHKCADLLNKIRIIAKNKLVILLDYDTNSDIEDSSKPLSHASLIKSYIENETH